MRTYDLLIVGGGVQGLWVARFALAAGMRVAIADAGACGRGASGGLLGALMAHMPTPWGDKKQFQFDALVEMEDRVREIEAETGFTTGYERSGRILAIRKARFREVSLARAAASGERWNANGGGYRLEILPGDAFGSWLVPDHAAYGLVFDTLAARVDPQRYVAALKCAVQRGGCDIFEGWTFAAFDPVAGIARGVGGEAIGCGQVVLAAGHETFGMVRRMTGLDLGGGVKGQAALLEPAGPLPGRRPIIYDDGLYIVAHSDRRVAVGSTSEAEWDDASSTDAAIAPRIAAARAISPPLRDAKVIARWAGVRPKAWTRDPIVGPIEASGRVFVASGGFKITFGIAHRIARETISWMVRGEASSALPATFRFAHHARQARMKRNARAT